MAGLYFKFEGSDMTLAGYFRLRGEVEALGIVSVSIELYLEMRYETGSGKCVGTATLSIEIDVALFSATIEISATKKFAGSGTDPTLAELMDVQPDATSDVLERVLRGVRVTSSRRSSGPRCRNGTHRGRPAAPVGARGSAPAQRRRQRRRTASSGTSRRSCTGRPAATTCGSRSASTAGRPAEGIPEADADPVLWDLLFPPETRVGPHVFQDHA